jgi:hypothetical protein
MAIAGADRTNVNFTVLHTYGENDEHWTALSALAGRAKARLAFIRIAGDQRPWVINQRLDLSERNPARAFLPIAIVPIELAHKLCYADVVYTN